MVSLFRRPATGPCYKKYEFHSALLCGQIVRRACPVYDFAHCARRRHTGKQNDRAVHKIRDQTCSQTILSAEIMSFSADPQLQQELLAAAVYVGLPLYYLFTYQAWSASDQRYYDYLVSQNRAYPRGAWQNVFWIAWTVLYPCVGAASYLFWRDHSASNSVDAYVAGNVLHWLGLLFNFGWARVFFTMRRPVVAFIYCLLSLAGGVGFFACSIIVGAVASAILTGFYVAWLVFATYLTGVAAFAVAPMPRQGNSDDDYQLNEEDWRQPLNSQLATTGPAASVVVRGFRA